jgi:predicted oxidoreductase (fatty acid repression mutant protein)
VIGWIVAAILSIIGGLYGAHRYRRRRIVMKIADEAQKIWDASQKKIDEVPPAKTDFTKEEVRDALRIIRDSDPPE